MASFKIRKVRDSAEMEILLNGGIVGGVDITGGVVGLVGQKLKFTAPAGEVTFVTASKYNDMLQLSDIKAQIETALNAANIKVFAVNGRIAFIHPTATSAIALDVGTSTTPLIAPAKGILGFDANTAVSGKVYGAVVGSPPALVSAVPTPDNSYVVITIE